MKKKRALNGLSRQEVAQELTRIAGRIADGALNLDGYEFPLPDKLGFELVALEEKGRFSLRLFVKGKRGLQARPGNRYLKRKRPYEAKKLKKALGGYWKEINRCIKNRCRMEDKEQLLSILHRYGRLSEPQWQQGWAICRQQVLLLLDLMEQGDFKRATDLWEEIEELIKSCHKKYK